MPRAWTIFTRVPKMTIIEIDEIRGEQIFLQKYHKLESVLNDCHL
jgi:hypothetical protein